MKKHWKLLSLTLFLFVLGGCDQITYVPTNSNADSQTTLLNSESAVTSTIDVETLALQATGAEMLFLPFLGGSSLTNLGLVLVDDATEPIIDDSVVNLDQYLGLISQFLDTDNGGLNVVVADSDREGYTYMATYTIQTLYDGVQTYTIYYNEILPIVEEPVTDDSVTEDPITDDSVTEDTDTEDPVTDETTTQPLSFHVHEPFTFEYDDEVVLAYIDALLVVGDSETALEGAYVQEGEDTVLNLYAYTDSDNYVKVNYVTEADGKQKFNFEVKSEGLLVSKAKISVDFQDGFKTVRLEFATETTLTTFSVVEETSLDGTTYKVRYAIVSDGSIVESGNILIFATVDSETGDTTYTYEVLPDGWLHSHQFDFEDHGHHGGQNQDSWKSGQSSTGNPHQGGHGGQGGRYGHDGAGDGVCDDEVTPDATTPDDTTPDTVDSTTSEL